MKSPPGVPPFKDSLLIFFLKNFPHPL